MPPKYAHVHVEGDWGIRLGKGTITIEVWDKKDRKIGAVAIHAKGVDVSGKTGRAASAVKWDELNR
jgi:hypothetical protein